MRTDKRTVLVVIFTLAAVVITALLAMVALSFLSRRIPNALPHAFDLALGGLLAMLAKTSTPAEDLDALAAATPPGTAAEPSADGTLP